VQDNLAANRAHRAASIGAATSPMSPLSIAWITQRSQLRGGESHRKREDPVGGWWRQPMFVVRRCYGNSSCVSHPRCQHDETTDRSRDLYYPPSSQLISNAWQSPSPFQKLVTPPSSWADLCEIMTLTTA